MALDNKTSLLTEPNGPGGDGQSAPKPQVELPTNTTNTPAAPGINTAEATVVYKKLKYLLFPALAANPASWFVSSSELMFSLDYLIQAAFDNIPLDGEVPIEDLEELVLKLSGVLAIIFLPYVFFWTRPKMSAAKLRAWNISPPHFTAYLITAVTGLFVMQRLLIANFYIAFVIRMATCFLLNELKWSQVYFVTNWFPKSEYTKITKITMFAGWGLNFAYCWIFIALGALLPILIPLWTTLRYGGYLLAAWYIYAKVSELPDDNTLLKDDLNQGYKHLIESDPTFEPLEWNHPDSYNFYKVDLKNSNRWYFYVYFICQYL